MTDVGNPEHPSFHEGSVLGFVHTSWHSLNPKEGPLPQCPAGTMPLPCPSPASAAPLPCTSDSFLAQALLCAPLPRPHVLIIPHHIPEMQQDPSQLEGRVYIIEEGQSRGAILGEGISEHPRHTVCYSAIVKSGASKATDSITHFPHLLACS